MGIAEEIRKNLQERILIKYRTDDLSKDSAVCEICTREFTLTRNLCIYIKDDGYICHSCADRFAPEITDLWSRIEKGSDLEQSSRDDCKNPELTQDEWYEIHKNLQLLFSTTSDLAKGISRGIVEAPSGHIGLLHFAKDIVKPPRKEGENDSDYELRVKGYRMSRICEKIKKETAERVLLLKNFFNKLGMPKFPDSES